MTAAVIVITVLCILAFLMKGLIESTNEYLDEVDKEAPKKK